MRSIEIENWVNRIADRVARGAPLEDSRVELKREWPTDTNKLARQIGGHCNANAGDTVLWIIGIDEAAGVVGASQQDLSTWWPTVKREFDGASPGFQDLVVDAGGIEVVALAFDTDGAPYMVRNAVHGQLQGGPVAREIPWRQGTSTSTATRAQLLSILLPIQAMPAVDIISATATARVADDKPPDLDVTITLYAVLPMGSGMVLPNHRAQAWYRLPGDSARMDLAVSLAAQRSSVLSVGVRVVHPDPRVHTVLPGEEQVILDGPGFLRVFCRGRLPKDLSDLDASVLHVSAQLRPAAGDLAVPLEQLIPLKATGPFQDRPGVLAEWSTA